ncbi:hypothetical protein H5410_023728 [Solanum commersonii]|uniref:Uncharacterized protein n=1 Tax=Solanum commersonii TaxID=4109 RepID=A0A9J5ZJF3_SOLCO|nr:hypothetical protein H5410_023728 [Solanum commersonii]
MNTKAAKKMNNPNFIQHNTFKKTCATANVNNMFMETVTLCAADRTSSGEISLGINHPNGPHENAKAATNTHMHRTTNIA